MSLDFLSFFCKNVAERKVLKIQPLEIKLDQATNEPYVMVTPIYKSKYHKCLIEELIENDMIINKLEEKSHRYLFYAYGMLKAIEKNDIFVLVEILLINKEIKIKNMKTHSYEYWNKEIFNKKYMLLDKRSLRAATEFFYNLDSDLNMGVASHDGLRLVK